MREQRNDPKRLNDPDLVWEAISVDCKPIRERMVKYLEEIKDIV